jgi:hypothetical protein
MVMNLFKLVVLLCLSQIARGQEREYVIPFTLTSYNNLSVQAILNQKDTVELMFHTAASSVTLTEETMNKIKTLRFDGADSVSSWGGAGNTSRYSKGNSLQIGQLNWENLSIWEDKNSGQNTDGKFGINLFENKVVELDFDKKIIILRSSLPDNIGTFEKLKLTYKNEMLFVEAGCEIGDTVVQNRFLLHSGYSGAVLLDDKFVSDNAIDQKLKIVDEKELKDSFGHIIKTKRAILPAFVLGKEKLDHVPVGFFQGAIGRQKMSILGGDVLKRFNIIIDAQREYIYLKSNHFKKDAYWG